MRFWLGVIAASLTLTAPDVLPVTMTETFVREVPVAELWRYEPLPTDVEEHAQCLIDVVEMLGLELTVDTLFVVGDYADLQGGPCGLLP